MNAPRISLAHPFGLALIAASVIACSSAPELEASQEKLGQAASAVIKGKPSDKSQNDVVLLIHYDPTQQAIESCSGTFLAPNLILTARHCVADTDESAACDVTGAPLAQGAIRGNRKADTLYVFIGQNRPDFGGGNVKPDGVGAKILDDGGKNLCNHDIALLLLKDPVPNAQIAQIRLDAPITKGEIITAVGWGVTDTTSSPDVRQQRTGIKVENIGPDDTTPLPVPPNEFQVGESICSGDSGGPALASTGAIVGVVSRGGNSTQPNPNDPSTSCTGANASNLYTKVAAFKDFIENGYKLAGADPWYEGGPDPRLLKPGQTCRDASECRSNFCDMDPAYATARCHGGDASSADTTAACEGAGVCAQDCTTDPTVCDPRTTCVTEGASSVCKPTEAVGATNKQTTTTSGCSTGPGNGSANGALGLVLAALGLVALRRRRAA